jgi:hypothetical protein
MGVPTACCSRAWAARAEIAHGSMLVSACWISAATAASARAPEPGFCRRPSSRGSDCVSDAMCGMPAPAKRRSGLRPTPPWTVDRQRRHGCGKRTAAAWAAAPAALAHPQSEPVPHAVAYRRYPGRLAPRYSGRIGAGFVASSRLLSEAVVSFSAGFSAGFIKLFCGVWPPCAWLCHSPAASSAAPRRRTSASASFTHGGVRACVAPLALPRAGAHARQQRAAREAGADAVVAVKVAHARVRARLQQQSHVSAHRWLSWTAFNTSLPPARTRAASGEGASPARVVSAAVTAGAGAGQLRGRGVWAGGEPW